MKSILLLALLATAVTLAQTPKKPVKRERKPSPSLVKVEDVAALTVRDDLRVGGGASTVRQYLQAQLIDELLVAVSPTLLGTGEPLLAGLDLPKLGYKCEQIMAGERAAFYRITRA